MFTQMTSNNFKTSVKFLICKLPVNMGKDGSNSSPTPTLLFFLGQPGHSRWRVTVGHSFRETSTDEGSNVRILLCVVPLPPCSSQGRKVLRWKPRDARPPATTCSFPQPAAINSPPSKIHPALCYSHRGKSASSLSEHLERFRHPETEVFPRGLERPSLNQAHQIPQQEASLLFSNFTLGK